MSAGQVHDHAPAEFNRAFAIGTALNMAYVAIEAFYGWKINSLSLIADAAHNLTDVAGLLLAWGAMALSRRKPTARHTYGLGRATILAALANAVAILAGAGAIVWEALRRFSEPVPVVASTVLLVAAIGIAVNGGTALLFLRDRHRDLNVRGAFLHMATDAAVSGGVVGAALIILVTGWTIIDPAAAIIVSLLVGWSAFDLFRSAFHLSLDGVPNEVDTDAVECWLRALPGVTAVHDLHVWSLSTTATAMTAHLIMPNGPPGDEFLVHVAEGLDREFHIAHSTIQIESGDESPCRLASKDIA